MVDFTLWPLYPKRGPGYPLNRRISGTKIVLKIRIIFAPQKVQNWVNMRTKGH